MSEERTADLPDLAAGVALEDLPAGTLLAGQAGGEPVLLARTGDELFAVGATCPHYGAPLAGGLLVDHTLHCPWHHACFDLRSGAVLRPPALDALPCWRVEQRGGRVSVRERLAPAPARRARASRPGAVVIVGGGAAGSMAAETLRREGYAGRITLLSADASAPCDRPSLSKGYLAGRAGSDAPLLRPPSFYAAHGIELALDTAVARLDLSRRRVQRVDGRHHDWDALLLATGAEPVRLDVPGATLRHVHYLRTLADSRALAASALASRRAVVVGASFIGMEAAAALRARGVDVDVVARGPLPMAHVLGPAVGEFVRALHARHGVRFHPGTRPAAIDRREVTLDNGERLPADLVVVGIGVRPALALAEQAGLALDDGVLVDPWLRSSAPDVYAAGDIARWPDPRGGGTLRVEHWAVAQRQGRTAALNLLGRRERFEAVPFFWTRQYGVTLACIGDPAGWDKALLEGRLDAEVQDATVTYRRSGRTAAVAVIGRDLAGLRAERAFEREIAAAHVPRRRSAR